VDSRLQESTKPRFFKGQKSLLKLCLIQVKEKEYGNYNGENLKCWNLMTCRW